MSFPHRSALLRGSLALVTSLLLLPGATMATEALLPAGWNAKAQGDAILQRLVRISDPKEKGAHDAEMVLVGNRAYVVYEANDERAGESAAWPSMYVTLSVVNLDNLTLEKTIPIAKSGQAFANETIAEGACFVPRILQRDANTLRCYFASESPGKREAQTYFLDFDIQQQKFHSEIHRAKLKTADGTFEMQPKHFHADATRAGFAKPVKDFGLYVFDSFKVIDGTTYVALNNYPGGQNALARLNAEQDTFEVLGHYNEPDALKLTESAVNRLPDGTWMAIVRQEGGNRNYVFTTSKDGRTWTAGEHLSIVPNGASSKPTFDRIGDTYYLGWQENTQIDGVGRSVFNVEVSRDGKQWVRKYRFETTKSFQYPVFREHQSKVYVAVTHGDSDPSRKERIMFGVLEEASP